MNTIARMYTLTCIGLGIMSCSGDKAKLPEQPIPSLSPSANPDSSELQNSAAVSGSTAEAASTTTFTGATEAHRRSTLTPRVGGAVVKVYVRDGDTVVAGEPLVALDTEDFALRVAQAEAGVMAAKAGFEASKLEWERIKSLSAERVVPQNQFDMVNAKYQASQAQLAQAEATNKMAHKALADSIIRAPFSGVIIKRHVSEGEYATVMPPSLLITVEEIDPIDLRIFIPATQMEQVHVGDALNVKFTTIGKEVQAKVNRVVKVIDTRTRNFAITAELPNPDHRLWSGVFAEVQWVKDKTQVVAKDGSTEESEEASP